jgi:hypothetical protein
LKKILMGSAVALMLILSGCDDSTDSGLSSIDIGDLGAGGESKTEAQAITFKNGDEEYTYKFCADGDLRPAPEFNKGATYIVNGVDNTVTLMNLADRNDPIYDTDGKFEVGKEYTVDDHKETVEKIEITECEAQ